MRLTSLILSLVMLAAASQHCKADEWKSIVFLHAKNNETPQTQNSDTGVAMVVRQAEFGRPPKDCPVAAFWALNDNTLVDCVDGKQFQLMETEASKQKGGLALVPKPSPDPDPSKTDKPGPMNADPSIGNDKKVLP